MKPLIFIGGLIGLVSRGFSGMVIGALIGWLITRVLKISVIGAATKIQSQFLDSTFAVMGAVCKADGQVTHDEIRIEEMFLVCLHLRGMARGTVRSSCGDRR